jgi:undecaprenol kinase/diacylglycerol kinase (ATP)
MSFSIKARIRSFLFAFNGLRILLREEHNARIHMLGAVFAILLGVLLQLSPVEWLAITLCIGIVFVLEILNSAIERLADFVAPNHHQLIGQVKDLSAAGVLVGAVTSLIIGLLIFIPKIILIIHYVN